MARNHRNHDLHQEEPDKDNHSDPFDAIESAQSEKVSLASNPYEHLSREWEAWREGWLARMRWDQNRDKKKVLYPK